MTTSSSVAGWHPDPTGRHEQRYWSGVEWTDHVVTRGVQTVDALIPAPIPTSVVERAEPTEMPNVETSTQPEPSPVPALRPEQPHLDQEATGSPPSDARHVPTAEPSIPMFGARKYAEKLQSDNAQLQRLIDEHGLRDIASLEAERTRLEDDVSKVHAELAAAQAGVVAAQHERAIAAAEVVDLRAVAGIQEFGLYDFEHPAEDSVKLAGDLSALRVQISQAVRDDQATTATSNFTFNNSTAKGAKFVRDMSKLMLRSYNAEAENCIKSVRAGNLDAARTRLGKTVEQVERLGTMINLQITPYYHRLRLAELELAARHLQALVVEKEAERARREELREQNRAEQELRAERVRLEKERAHYANALAALEARGDLEGAERMREQIADADRAISDVDYRVANARAGYVYVISNVGSFGPDVVKIGMTRRLEPMDRVNELGDASVPFRFDVHALFFSADAVALETALHQHFETQRINRVNLRREYFRATPAQVLEALRERNVEILEYVVEPLAEEFRASSAL